MLAIAATKSRDSKHTLKYSRSGRVNQVPFSWKLLHVVSILLCHFYFTGPFMTDIIVGNDVRKLVMDGYPMQNVIATDVFPGPLSTLAAICGINIDYLDFWALGYKLFKATSQTFKVAYVAGDIFDDSFTGVSAPVSPKPTDLSELKSLAPLHGHVSVIHAAAFFHLFDEEGQLKAARALASLLSPESGSLIFGLQGTADTPSEYVNTRGEKAFNHSQESWKELWDGKVFEKGTVTVESAVFDWEQERKPNEIVKYKLISWTVRRL